MKGSFAATLAGVGIALLVSSQALAGAREIYKCRVADGATYEDIIAANEIYRAAMNKAGFSDYKVELLYPLYDSDTRPGTVYWQGTSPGMERLGAANDWFWFHEDAAESRALFEKAMVCESAYMFFTEALE